MFLFLKLWGFSESLRGRGWLKEEGEDRTPLPHSTFKRVALFIFFYILGFPINFHFDGTKAPMRTWSEWAALLHFMKPPPMLPQHPAVVLHSISPLAS